MLDPERYADHVAQAEQFDSIHKIAFPVAILATITAIIGDVAYFSTDIQGFTTPLVILNILAALSILTTIATDSLERNAYRKAERCIYL